MLSLQTFAEHASRFCNAALTIFGIGKEDAAAVFHNVIDVDGSGDVDYHELFSCIRDGNTFTCTWEGGVHLESLVVTVLLPSTD